MNEKETINQMIGVFEQLSLKLPALFNVEPEFVRVLMLNAAILSCANISPAATRDVLNAIIGKLEATNEDQSDSVNKVSRASAELVKAMKAEAEAAPHKHESPK